MNTNDMRKRNNELDKKLTFENKTAMTDMVVYLRVSNISNKQVEEIRRDLLVMVLEAQDRGDDISSVIGDDYKSFCNQIIENTIPKTMSEKIFESIYILISALYILMTIQITVSSSTRHIITNLINHKKGDLSIPIDLGFVVSTLVILFGSYFIVTYIGKKAFEVPSKRILFGVFGIIFFSFVGSYELSNIILFKVNLLLLISVIIILFGTNKLFISKRI